MKRTTDNLIIMGKGMSVMMDITASEEYKEDCDIWRLNEGSGWRAVNKEHNNIWTFEIHDPRHHSDDLIYDAYGYYLSLPRERIRIIEHKDIPFSILEEENNNGVFCNTIAIELALAKHMGYKSITLCGCDVFNSKERKHTEEAAFVLWCSILAASGIEIILSPYCTAFNSKAYINRQFIEIGQKIGKGEKLSQEEMDYLAKYKEVYK